MLNQFYCHFYLVTESPTSSPLTSSKILPTSSSSFFNSSIVMPTPTVPSGK